MATLVCLAALCVGILAGATVGQAALRIDLPHDWALGIGSAAAVLVTLLVGLAGLDLVGVT
jgi:hypothetical protein